MNKEKRKLFNIRLNIVEAEYLNDASEYLGLNYSDTIRTLLRNFIRKKGIFYNGIKGRN